MGILVQGNGSVIAPYGGYAAGPGVWAVGGTERVFD